MLTIPLRPVANQNLQVLVENQPCTIELSQTNYGLFLSLAVDGEDVITGVLCQNRNRIVRSSYLGFVGDFCFVDTQGDEAPKYDGLGDRYVLLYLSPTDLLDLGV